MRRSVGDVVTHLRDEGLAPQGVEEVARTEMAKEFADHIPSYLRAAVAVGAFISTGFLLGFLFALADLRDETVRLGVGIVLMAAAAWVRHGDRNEFLRWAAVAVALAGGGLVTAAVAEMTDDPTQTSLACLACALLLIYFVRDYVLRFLATLAGGAALLVAVGAERAGQIDAGLALIVVATAVVWRVGVARRRDEHAEILEPVGYALLVVLFAGLIARATFASAHARFGADLGPEVRSLGQPSLVIGIVLTIALVALVWRLLDELDVPLSAPTAIAALFGAVALGVGALNSPGIIAGVAVLMLGFDRRNAQLVGLAALFLIVFLSFYYYNLELTLLEKSGVLVGSGALLIGIRQRIARSAESP